MLTKPRGTRDMLPDEMEARREIETRLRECARTFGYREVATPAFEETELFTIRSGEGIISEMYAFEDKGNRSISLRPELTAPVLRMYVNEGRSLVKPVKWCYFGDCFRYERPQKGRYRQFWQFGAELIDADSALADAEIIMLAYELLKAAGVTFTLKIGDLACMRTLLSETSAEVQAAVRQALDKRDSDKAAMLLTENGHEHLVKPLLALTKATTLPEIFAIIGDIPQRERIEEMCQILDAAGVAYELSPAIARGLDYYVGVVFEAFAEGLGAENQIMGGGAYRLAHLFGGEDTPSVGFAIGFDRIMVALSNTQIITPRPQISIIYLPQTRDAAVRTAAMLRMLGICVDLDLTGRSFSAQMKNAGKIADAAIIIGKKEVEEDIVTVKNLKTGDQVQWSLSALPEQIIEFLKHNECKKQNIKSLQ
ncbi:MAG: histidine--tRNA ligase [Methanomicrobiales archaeon]|nr:histidine--tRNA ligase [Methanomicrobiales archaeon]